MKLVIVLVCAIGFASCNASGHDLSPMLKKMVNSLILKSNNKEDLGTILGELGDCLDQDALQSWVIEKMTSDEDFQKLIEYLQSDHYRIIDAHIIADEWFNDHLGYLEDNGVNVYETLNAIRELLGLPPLEPQIKSATSSHRAPPDIEWELLHLLTELWGITKGSLVCQVEVIYKYHKDPALSDLLEQFEDPRFVAFLKYVWEKEEVKELFQLIQQGNIDLEYLLTVIKKFLSLVCDNESPFDQYKPMPLRLAQMYAKYVK